MSSATVSAGRILRPTRAEIRLSAVRNNLKKLGRTAAPAKLLFVVKANAYGHGAAELAGLAEREKLAWGFGVSSVEEGLALRAAGLKSPVLVLGSLYPFESFVEAISADLVVTIASLDAARQVIEAARKLGKKAVCHMKLETGMGRIGARRCLRSTTSWPRRGTWRWRACTRTFPARTPTRSTPGRSFPFSARPRPS